MTSVDLEQVWLAWKIYWSILRSFLALFEWLQRDVRTAFTDCRLHAE